MESFLKVLLIIIFIYYALKIIFKFFLRIVIKKVTTNYSTFQSKGASYNRREGEVSIDKVPAQEKQFGKDTGEYIEYEEVK